MSIELSTDKSIAALSTLNKFYFSTAIRQKSIYVKPLDTSDIKQNVKKLFSDNIFACRIVIGVTSGRSNMGFSSLTRLLSSKNIVHRFSLSRIEDALKNLQSRELRKHKFEKLQHKSQSRLMVRLDWWYTSTAIKLSLILFAALCCWSEPLVLIENNIFRSTQEEYLTA